MLKYFKLNTANIQFSRPKTTIFWSAITENRFQMSLWFHSKRSVSDFNMFVPFFLQSTPNLLSACFDECIGFRHFLKFVLDWQVEVVLLLVSLELPLEIVSWFFPLSLERGNLLAEFAEFLFVPGHGLPMPECHHVVVDRRGDQPHSPIWASYCRWLLVTNSLLNAALFCGVVVHWLLASFHFRRRRRKARWTPGTLSPYYGGCVSDGCWRTCCQRPWDIYAIERKHAKCNDLSATFFSNNKVKITVW